MMNQYIDHTLLKPEATAQQIIKLCEEAKEFKFKAVCVNSYFVKLAKEQLKDSGVMVCTVVGFPLGASTLETKRFEALKAIHEGAQEIDMVINVSALKSRQLDYVKEDIESLAKLCHSQKAILKVILETALLTPEEITLASKLALEAGADFIKTSTGFSSRGASLEDIRLMREATSDKIKIKASGGIKDLETAMSFIQAGAHRLGTSSGVALMNGHSSSTAY